MGTAHGHYHPGVAGGTRRWNARRLEVSRFASWRRFNRFSYRGTSGRAHGFHRGPESGQPDGYRHHDYFGRSDLSGRHGVEPGAFLRARVLRLVYALLERSALGRTDIGRDGGRTRTART